MLTVACCLLMVQASAWADGASERKSEPGFTVHAGQGMMVHEVVVEARPEQVWMGWTTNRGIEAFFASKADVELRIGGRYELHFAPGATEGSRGTEGCTVLAYLPHEMLSFTWNAPPSIPKLRDARILTHVVLTFDELGDGQVKVRLAHLGLGTGEDWDKYRAYFDRAWPHVLNQFRDKVGSIDPVEGGERPDPRLRFELTVDAPVEQVWEAFTTKAGIESWMVPLGDVDLRVGGLMRTNYNREGTFDDASAIAHRIMSFEPNRMMAFQVVKFPEGFPHVEASKGTWNVVRLEGVGEKRTRVVLTGAGLREGPQVDQMVQFFQAGNRWTLEQLRKKFAAE